MKGKKFTAAEKHFQEKEVKIRQEMKRYTERIMELIDVNHQLSKENEVLKSLNAEIKEKYEKLLEYSRLEETDIVNALERDKNLSLLSGMFQGKMNHLMYYSG
ncbi:hypothetical protein CEB3_c17760 [Peptococcaceae bacterium CEB3]|nr:hypothetical protein CEB3_c17760 [Peptococcaceae bacterium CEB3]